MWYKFNCDLDTLKTIAGLIEKFTLKYPEDCLGCGLFFLQGANERVRFSVPDNVLNKVFSEIFRLNRAEPCEAPQQDEAIFYSGDAILKHYEWKQS